MKIQLLLCSFVLLFSSSCKSQDIKMIELSRQEYDAFSDSSEIKQKVFSYYFDIGYNNKKIKNFNNAQNAIYYYFICDGLIGNGGFISILQETSGVYNDGFKEVLQFVGDEKGDSIFSKVISIYDNYKKYFDKQDIPPQLDEEANEYDKELDERLIRLENEWYNDSENREQLFFEYFNLHKNELMIVK